MPSKKHRPEEVIGKLREAEVVLAQGATTARGKVEWFQGRRQHLLESGAWVRTPHLIGAARTS